MKFITSLLLVLLSSFTVLSQTCGQIYVSPNGSGVGTKSDPASLEDALTAASSNDILRLSIGTYSLDNPLNLISDVTIEGGFDSGNGWSKTSLAGATTINRTSLNPEGAVNATRLVAFYGNGISNFRLQDLTITTDNAVLSGGSTYAVHLNNCSDYTIARCQLLPGNAGNGADGADGINGLNGGNGSIGGSGSCDGGNCTFGGGDSGGAGGSGGNGSQGVAQGNDGIGINGGGGGPGGKGSDECSSNAQPGGNGGGSSSSGINIGGGSPGSDGDPGGDGTDGANGINGNNGVLGASGPIGSHVTGFYIPGAQAGTGTNGAGGQGGAGGGGGGRQNCTFCDDGPGNGGGGGGGGGQGGTGGTGGYGGGSSYGLYLFNNGVNGNVIQCNFMAGPQGSGGVGGAGGTGGAGGLGASGRTVCSSEVGEGGDGGNGGSGGDGGTGGNGASGEAINVYLNSGNPLTTNISSFNLAAQPEIIKDSVYCAGKFIKFESTSLPTGIGVTSWDFDVVSNTASPSTGVNNPDSSVYNTAGRYTIDNNGEVYEGFVYILPEQTIDAGIDQQLCDVTTGALSGSTSGNNVTWTSLGTATIDNPSSLTSGIQNLQPGENKFVLNANDCCPADPDTVLIFVGNSNTGTDVQTACGSYSWIDGNTYTVNNNTATHVLTNETGCDSTVTLNLTITNSSTGTDVQTACGSYTWIDGNTYTANNNTATHVLTNAAGCDSTVTLNLTITNSTSGTDTQTACDSFTWIDGNTYTSNNNTATHVLTNAAGCDSTVTLDLTVTSSSSSTDVQTACNSFTWIDGITYTTDNNTATYVLTNTAGCDSVVNLDLTVTAPDVSITNNAPSLLANSTSGTFQWINCDENFDPILGATDASFTTDNNGTFAVIVTENGCSDTSACVTIANVGLDNSTDESLIIYPNPTSGLLTISNSSIIQSIKVIDPTGRIIFSDSPKKLETTLNLGNYAKGLYSIVIELDDKTIRRKVLKQ